MKRERKKTPQMITYYACNVRSNWDERKTFRFQRKRKFWSKSFEKKNFIWSASSEARNANDDKLMREKKKHKWNFRKRCAIIIIVFCVALEVVTRCDACSSRMMSAFVSMLLLLLVFFLEWTQIIHQNGIPFTFVSAVTVTVVCRRIYYKTAWATYAHTVYARVNAIKHA